MLRGGDENALFHEAGGVTHAGDVTADGLDGEAVQIDAVEDDAASGRSGKHSQGNRRAAMQTNPTAFHCVAECLLLSQKSSCKWW